jgi:hypothetical protein
VQYRSEAERIKKQHSENYIGRVGRTEPSYRDHLGITKRMLAQGASKSEIRDFIAGPSNPNPGIRAYCTVRLDSTHPELNIMKRLLMDAPTQKNPNPDYIAYSRLKTGDMPNLVIRSVQEELDKKNEQIAKSTKQGQEVEFLTPLSDEELDTWLRWYVMKDANYRPAEATAPSTRGKRMDDTRLASIVENSGNSLLTLVKDAIANNEVERMLPFQELKPLTNALHKLHTAWGFRTNADGVIQGPLGQLNEFLEYLTTLSKEDAAALLEEVTASVE